MNSASSKEALRQLDQFWSMLDDLCENDPAAYRGFIEKQMKEGAEYSSPPEIHTCLRTEILGPRRGFLYINICSWKRVPAPQDPSRPLPVFAGKLETDTKEGQDCCTVLDIALNPEALEENQKGDEEVCMLALNFARQQYGLRLSEEYDVVSCSPKGSQSELHQRLGYQQWPDAPKQPDPVSQTPAALLQQISSLQSENRDEDVAAPIMCGPAENKSKDLIQVISTTYAQPQEPEYQLEVKTDAAGGARSVTLTVELPKVCSMSDCQLRISKDDVLLEAEDLYYLLLKLPETVDEDTASAVFNKKKQRLTLTVDVL